MNYNLVMTAILIICFGQNTFAVDLSDFEVRTIFTEKRHFDDIQWENTVKKGQAEIPNTSLYKKQCIEKYGREFGYSGIVSEREGDLVSQFILCVRVGARQMTQSEKMQNAARYLMDKASLKLKNLYKKACAF